MRGNLERGKEMPIVPGGERTLTTSLERTHHKSPGGKGGASKQHAKHQTVLGKSVNRADGWWATGGREEKKVGGGGGGGQVLWGGKLRTRIRKSN